MPDGSAEPPGQAGSITSVAKCSMAATGREGEVPPVVLDGLGELHAAASADRGPGSRLDGGGITAQR
jgi:hypothetical protein